MHDVLLSDYNYYRLHTASFRKRPQMRSLKSTPERIAAIQKMNRWCSERGLDPRLWLYHLFRARQWIFAPPFNQLIPSKKNEQKALTRYHTLTAVPMFAKRMGQEVQKVRTQQGRAHVWDPNRDLSNASESRKRRYLLVGQEQVCMSEMLTRTYGYHPQSTVCARCTIAHICLAQLQALVHFDILALRRGETSTISPVGQTINGRGPQTTI